MKRNIFKIFTFIFALAFISCASNNVISEKNEKTSYFEDWRYKGFGAELPAWFEPAYLKDSVSVKNVLSNFTESDVIIGGNAISADHAEQLIAINKNVEGYEFIDSCWAKLSEKVVGEYSQTPYVFLIVLKKINE